MLPLRLHFVDPELNCARAVVTTVDRSFRLLLAGEIVTVFELSLAIAAVTWQPKKFHSVVPGLVDDVSDGAPVALWLFILAS